MSRTRNTNIPSKRVRQLKAAMALKHVTLKDVVGRTRIPYVTASNIIRGAMNHDAYLARLESVVRSIPEPTAA